MKTMTYFSIYTFYISLLALICFAKGIDLTESCNGTQYYDPGLMMCESCPTNASMVPSTDGFGCKCAAHSIPVGPNRCKSCNATELVSTDGRNCVPRKCQQSSGRIACRKCPNDYISVTQNFDGSPMKEVLCVKCARGFKAQNNACVRCEGCACTSQETVVSGACVRKKFINERPKYDGSMVHPTALLEIVKHEYFCIQNHIRACRTLASGCVRNFYLPDLAGPCRLWLQANVNKPKGLPPLQIEATTMDKSPGEVILDRKMDSISLAVAVHTAAGGMKILYHPNEKKSACLLPFQFKIGNDFSEDCSLNVSELALLDGNDTFAPFLHTDGNLRQLPVSLRKSNSYYVQKDTWPMNKFRRYFLIENYLSSISNMTSTVYLRTLLIHVRIERDKYKSSSLKAMISVEAQYAIKSSLSHMITTSLVVKHEMPSAGIYRGLEVWGSVLGALLALYAVVQWRGVLRRGGLQYSLFPLLCGSVADALYFAAWFSTLHALAAETGALGITLPLSKSEEHIISAFVYSCIALKGVKIIWLNWNQCRYDIFFLDWSQYNSPLKETTEMLKSNNWRVTTLAREWSNLQTIRRASPGFTVTMCLSILYFLVPWQEYLPQSRGYKWAVATIVWWSSYGALLVTRWVLDKLLGSPISTLPDICTGAGLSLLVFQEEYYAHYVHGRCDDMKDVRTLSGPLATCRVLCAPQLRVVYKQLSTPGPGILEGSESRHALLSRFLAAFFERALDGLSWVASERTIPERLLDVEFTVREAGTTSTLLYDPESSTPSCFSVTWWGEEWSLGTFDAMLFGCIYIATDDHLLAGLVTLFVWQIMKHMRRWFGNRNIKEKVDNNLML